MFLRSRRWSWLALVALALVTACSEPIPDQLSSDLDFLTGTPRFANYADEVPGWELDAELAVRLFGAEAVCVPGSNPCQATEVASAWIDEVNDTLRHGHSEGIALTTLAFHLERRGVSDFGVDDVAALSLTDPQVKREIAYWAATQKVPAALKNDRSFQAKDVMPFLAKALKPGQREAWRLAVVMKDEAGFRGGHALVPFGFFKGKGEGQYFLRVYDSNWPGKEQRVFIDARANTWSYEGSRNAEAPRSYRGDPTNGNLLYFSPLSAHQGPFEAPFADTARSLVVAASGSGVMLKDEGGAQVGIGDDGVVVENGGAVRPAFAQSRCVLCPGPAEIVNYTLSPDAGMTGAQTINLSGFGNNSADGGTVNITGAGLSAQLAGVRTESSGALIEVSGKSMTYSSSESKTPTSVTVTVAGPNGTSTTVTVALSSSPLGSVKIDASDPNNITVTTRNQQGDTVTGTVTVTTTSATGEKKTTSAAIEVEQGKTSTAAVQPSTGTASVTPAPGTACDNGRLDPTLADGGATGSETDVDCGGLCPRCGERKACRVAADCSSAVCAAGRCQAPSCFDRVRNGDEEDVDCGGSCFAQSCRPGQICRGGFDCAATTYGSVCYSEPDGGVSRCQARQRQNLLVTGLGAGSQINLNGTSIDGQSYADWRVTGGASGGATVPFDGYRYRFQLGGQQPAPYQGNFSCALRNPTNDPALLAQGGNGDGGQPTLACTRVASTVVVKARGCFGMSVPVDVQLDGVSRSVSVPLNGVTGNALDPSGVGSLELGTFRQSSRVASPSRGSLTFDTVMGTARRQTCPVFSESHYANENRGVFELNYECDCATGDFRGPTVSGDPCATAEIVLGTLTENQFVDFTRDTSTVSNNDFVFMADAGCGGNPNPAGSGSDKAFRVTVPPGLDLIASLTPVSSPRWKGQLSLITNRAQCGTNGATARTTGTTGARCASTSSVDASGSASVRYYNSGTSNQDVYVVLEGNDMGDQGPYVLTLGAVTHPFTVSGDACSDNLAIGANTSQSGRISRLTNDIIFSSASSGCTAATTPSLSPNDAVYRLAVPAQTRLTVELERTPQYCSVSGHLVRGAACGTNGPTAATTGTTGLSCVASDYPRSATYGCTRRPLVYDNRGNSPEVVYLVLESLFTGSTPNFAFTARTGPILATQVSTSSGPAYEGNPCQSAPRRTWERSTEDIMSTTNNFYVLNSATCSTTAAASTPSGSDAVIQYSVQPSYELLVKANAIFPFVGDVPFFMHAVLGANDCGNNASDFLDAGTTGLTCALSGPAGAGAYGNPRTLRYLNTTSTTQEVFVVFDAVSSSPEGIRYLIDATLSPPDAGSDGGADAGSGDAGTPDAGPPDAGPPDAGPPDAGPPDAGPPDAGPPDAGPPDAGPTLCSTDSQCASNNCYCAGTPGNCLGVGRCVPGRAVISAPTAGVTASGTFTVPTGCTEVHLSAWGAGGGQAADMFGMSNAGGPGGYVSGLLSVAPGDVFTVWIGRGGQNTSGIIGDEGQGSYFGVSTIGGAVEVGAAAGGGGGLTSIQQTGGVARSFTVPSGGGASVNQAAQPAGGTGAGSNSTRAGGDAQVGTQGGGGGAGENGGLGASSFQGAGDPGAWGTLPAGLTSQNGVMGLPGMLADPAQTGTPNYALCPSGTGAGQGGNGCFVVRCTTP